MAACAAGLLVTRLAAAKSGEEAVPPLVRSARSGSWSAPDTWEAGKVPTAGARVQVRTGHTVTYDLMFDQVIRSIHVAGTLTFARDRDTRLDVGLIKIQPGDDATEEGFDCDVHFAEPEPGTTRPALVVGTPDQPVDARHTALIRLTMVDGLDKQSCPAIVCCSGRMDLHGAALSRTWVKLGATASKGDKTVLLAEPVGGWKVGDRIIVTATAMSPYAGQPGTIPDPKGTSTEVRTIEHIEGAQPTLDAPLEFQHLGDGLYRGEVANLSRNVIVESADPQGERGHTMYHRGSAGAISYAEFRHLGKQGVLGRYALHYHLCGDTMRGSYVIGASIWDSANRWLTIHGTNYLVARDNVGYLSKGHGFFLEDGTEVYNVLDRNLAVGARPVRPLPKQVLEFDPNDGAGFWWANSLNTFTRNVATENGLYGFRCEALVPLVLPIQQPDGSVKKVDVRTLPFVRFDDNESHSQTGNYGVKLDIANVDGHGVVDGVGPDTKHPFIIRNLLIWHVHYGFNTGIPVLLLDGLRLHETDYGYFVGNCANHVYRNITLSGRSNFPLTAWPVKQRGGTFQLTVDGLTLEGTPEQQLQRASEDGYGLIFINEDGATHKAAHFRNVTPKTSPVHVGPYHYNHIPNAQPRTPREVIPVYLHDYYGPGRHAKVVSTSSENYSGDGLTYREEAPFSSLVRVAEVSEFEFPKLLDPVDDLPPTSAITHVRKLPGGGVLVRGVTADNGTVQRVLINDREANPLAPNFAQWEIKLQNVPAGEVRLQARAEDTAGNIEPNPHVIAR